MREGAVSHTSGVASGSRQPQLSINFVNESRRPSRRHRHQQFNMASAGSALVADTSIHRGARAAINGHVNT